MTSPTDHVDVAAYVLGALDESENAAFERHLATCPRCQAELNELSGLPSLLDQVRGSGLLADLLGDDLTGPTHGSLNPGQGLSTPPPMLGNAGPFPSGPPAPPSGPRHGPRPPMSGLPDLSDFRPAPQLPAPPRPEDNVLQGVMVNIADARRRRKRTGLLAAAAAAVLIVGGPLLTLGLTGAFSSGPAETIQASNGPVSAKIGLTGDDHGTGVSFDLTGVKGPLDCTLYAVSKDGKTKRSVSSWTVDAKGYGTAENSAALHIDGNTSIARQDLGKLEFAREDGPDILDVDV
ncbi:anti-sigma factor family protein [Kutzneria sp. CA-103260]|uniref:anti-sigma factor family protein n=1 Tax=Kutzneria sp. CA-103260 TaxID=2802641 RepID=UPI001BA8605C|nr:zf-HC2 domain-containing protein [Kutzneria sp. CA-103260]QUQ68452.1 RNA polymerase subunit sigma [Kutzneria sp. CA-103260]